MAEPIKTTLQEALDHVKSWIKSGEKDKAIKGLQEILSFDAANAEAQTMLKELQASATFAVAAPTIAPSTPPTSSVPVAPTPIAPPQPKPAPTPIAAPTTPAPAPIVPPQPKPAPTPTPAPPAPTTPIIPAIPTITTQPGGTAIAGGLSKNVKVGILIGGIAIAGIGGFLFYKSFVAPTQTTSEISEPDVYSPAGFTSDGKSMSATSTNSSAITPPATDSALQTPTAPDATSTVSTPQSDATTQPPVTPSTPPTAPSGTGTQGEKVKRR